MKRTKIVAGNWKMNTGLVEARELVTEIKGMIKDEVNHEVEVWVFPPFPFLSAVSGLLKDSRIGTGAQNVSSFTNGAYTGEVSASMLNSMDIHQVLIGHSERRQYFGENYEILKEKTNRALDAGLQVIFCCGETLEQRESSHHFSTVETQLKESLFHLSSDQFAKIVIAYEPVWAIGTGVTASAAQAGEMHTFIRDILVQHFGDSANQTRILYGGSVKPENAAELFSMENIDGGLIGGAALSSRSFTDIVKAAK